MRPSPRNNSPRPQFQSMSLFFRPNCPPFRLMSARAPFMSLQVTRLRTDASPAPWSSSICPVEVPLTAGFWRPAMGCIPMRSISTLLKRISLIERVIDIDDCLTESIRFNVYPSLFPPLICLEFDNVLSSSVCVFSLYSPYSSFRTFFSIA